jgi:hypothetical protein
MHGRRKIQSFSLAASFGFKHLFLQLRFKFASLLMGKNWTPFSHVSIPIVIKENKQEKKIYLAITSIIRNESASLKEWLDFHILAGVEHFFLYDNESSDDTEEILQPYIESGQVSLTYWPTAFYHSTQIFSYAHSVTRNHELVEWMAFIDADEFLFSPSQIGIQEVLKNSNDFNAFHINWTCFGGSNFAFPPSLGVIKSYTRMANLNSADEVMKAELTKIKSVVRVSALTDIKVHDSKVVGRIMSDTRDLRLNHYIVKSEQEFLAKLENSWEKFDPEAKWFKKRIAIKAFLEDHNVDDFEIMEFIARAGQNRGLKTHE